LTSNITDLGLDSTLLIANAIDQRPRFAQAAVWWRALGVMLAISIAVVGMNGRRGRDKNAVNVPKHPVYRRMASL
jgi:hypothetical protein